MSLVKPPAEIILTTFGEDNPEGQAARHFYVRLGFRPAELVPNAADGGTRQVFRRTIS